jgi:hypothetical protein
VIDAPVARAGRWRGEADVDVAYGWRGQTAVDFLVQEVDRRRLRGRARA